MYSLLREELNNYKKQNDFIEPQKNSSILITNLQKTNKNSNALSNDSKINDLNYYNKECELIINKFNPAKNSPPSNWQFRLIKRINSLSEINE